MKISAASSTSVAELLGTTVQPAHWLGACDRALYLLTRSETVLAVLTQDAVRLPCGVVLPTMAAELPLSALAPPAWQRRRATVAVGDHRIEWAGPGGVVTVACVRQWTPPSVPTGEPRPDALIRWRTALAGRETGLEPDQQSRLVAAGNDASAQASAALALLGRGPGLTPSGDDLLAGFLIGAQAFGRPATGIEQVVADHAHRATTALSAQLLRHAVRGECLGELAAAAATITGPWVPDAVHQLLMLGHTSGAALAHGLLAAAEPAPSAIGTVSTVSTGDSR